MFKRYWFWRNEFCTLGPPHTYQHFFLSHYFYFPSSSPCTLFPRFYIPFFFVNSIFIFVFCSSFCFQSFTHALSCVYPFNVFSFFLFFSYSPAPWSTTPHEIFWITSLFQTYSDMLFFSVTATSTIAFVYHARHHLMVWRVFAPKYLFETGFLLIVDWSLVLCAVVVHMFIRRGSSPIMYSKLE